MKKKIFEKKKPKLLQEEKVILLKEKYHKKFFVLETLKLSKTVSETAEKARVPVRYVYAAIKWWNELPRNKNGEPVIPKRKKWGRPGKKQEIIDILKRLELDNYSLKELRNLLETELGIRYTLNYICILSNKIRKEELQAKTI